MNRPSICISPNNKELISVPSTTTAHNDQHTNTHFSNCNDSLTPSLPTVTGGKQPDRNLSWPKSQSLLERARTLVHQQRFFVSVCHLLHSLERQDKVRHQLALQVVQKATEIRQEEGLEKALMHVKQGLASLGDISVVTPSKQDTSFLLFAPILMNYLRQYACKDLNDTCRGVVYVCTEMHKSKESGYENLASSTMRHLRATIGENLWRQAVHHHSAQKALGVKRKSKEILRST